MKLYIDGREIELDRGAGVSISLSVASVTRLETGRTGYSKTIRVPMTPKNRAVLGDAAEVHAAAQFNQEEHTARIVADGCTVIEGMPMMTRCESVPDGAGWYHINIIGAGKEWVQKASESMFREIEMPFEMNLNPSTVLQSWTWEQAVRFFPVQRDKFTLASDTLQSGVRMLTFEDYHPFINVRALMDAIAAQGGYSIRSEFMDGEFFRSLYISGKYPEQEVEVLEQRNGFLAKRFAAKQAVADRFGRVYADPFTTLSSVGNLVDTADPDETQNGAALDGVYNRNGCFRKVNGRIAYYPAESVVVGFEYKIRYRSDYKIASRNRLLCFDRMYLDDDLERCYGVMNKYPDRRPEFKSGWAYRLIVFGHAAGNSYKITYDSVTNPSADLTALQPSDYVETVLKTFATRSTEVSVASGTRVANLRLWLKAADGSYALYGKDWALYDGYIEETGQIDIAVTIRSAARRTLPSQPRYFDLVHFGGADEGMAMTLSDKVELRPVFMPHPCEGMTVEFADVAAHEIRQIDFVNGIKQMFNLYFYTDNLTRTIYAEPRDGFYRTEPVVDWSGRIDRARAVTVEELGADLSQWFTLRYQPGDGSSARWDEVNKQILGQWSAPVLNRFAKEGEKIYYNPIFTPSVSQSGVYPDAPAASLIQAGDRDRKGVPPESDNLNFPPKIVCFMGVENLPENQWWGWPAYGNQYPRIAFHDPGAGVSLAFEDRDGQQGLNGYYDKTLALYNRGRRITLYMNLMPDDIEPLIVPNGLERDFRALFRLTIDGEEVLCRLEEICDYNPGVRTSTKCVFLKE